MKYVIDIPDNIKPMDMLDCDTDEAVKMLASAKEVREVTAQLKGNTILAEQGKLYFQEETTK